jgi:citrate lyase subunit beta/citryl-CoA lyase
MRSKLLVPASRPEFFAEALASDADAISFDLEDAVRETRKAEARRAVQTFLQESPPRPCGKAIVVRANGHRTPHFEADVAAAAWPVVDMITLGDLFEPFGIGRTDALAVHGMQRGVLLMVRS